VFVVTAIVPIALTRKVVSLMRSVSLRSVCGIPMHTQLDSTAYQPSWPILICVLGRFRVLKAGQPLMLRNASKMQSLLANLAVAPKHLLARDAILEVVWPDVELDLATKSLYSLTYQLHKLMGDQLAGEAPVIQADGFYRLNTEAGVGLDTNWFESLASIGEQQARVGDRTSAVQTYLNAVELYHGDLIVSASAQALIAREFLRSRYLTLLAHLADESFADGNYLDSLNYATRLLSVDPCREDAHRLVMRCYVRRGERSQALHHYQICQHLLVTEYDATPEVETTELFNRIRLGQATG
jgi:DNA-binding SARP family transcriptional activator